MKHKVRLYHFSDVGDIERFVPRAPLRHPESEPLVYAIDERHSPLYLFPRQCPRVAVWKEEGPIRLYIDQGWESRWRTESIFRYEFDAAGFEDCQDHGAWVSRHPQIPLNVICIRDLVAASSATVSIVPSLAKFAETLFDIENKRFLTDEHVSMIRMVNLEDWRGTPGGPVLPKNPLN